MENAVAPAAAPVSIPSAPIPVQKSSSARSLFQQHQQQAQLNESQHFIDAGSESAASNVSGTTNRSELDPNTFFYPPTGQPAAQQQQLAFTGGADTAYTCARHREGRSRSQCEGQDVLQSE